MTGPLILRTYVMLRRLTRALIGRMPFGQEIIGGVLVKLEGYLSMRWFIRQAPNPLIYNEHKIFHRPEDCGVTLFLFFRREYECETSNVMKRLIKTGMRVVDLGAHIGFFTLLAAKAVGPYGKVYAFEPVPSTFGMLQKNIEVNGFTHVVIAIPKAVCGDLGTVRIFLVTNNSVSAKWISQSDNKPFVDVESVSLDSFFGGSGWPPIDFVKMDIEGAEKAALDGMRELSKKNPEMKLITEVNLANLEPMGISLEQFCDSLRNCGFSRFQVLWRNEGLIELPKEIPRLTYLAKRANINLLCEKG